MHDLLDPKHLKDAPTTRSERKRDGSAQGARVRRRGQTAWTPAVLDLERRSDFQEVYSMST